MDEKSKVLRVNEFLQVEGFENVFAAGDCCNAGLSPTITYAKAHSEVVAANIKAHAAGKSLTKFSPAGMTNITTLGHKYGSMQAPMGMVFGSTTSQKIKGDMFTGVIWQSMGFTEVFGEAKEPDNDPAHLQNVLYMNEDEAKAMADGLGYDPAASLDHT